LWFTFFWATLYVYVLTLILKQPVQSLPLIVHSKLVYCNSLYCNISNFVQISSVLAQRSTAPSIYHTVNGDRALFYTSKTAKMIKVRLLRAPCQNVNVLLSNITFIIFAVFDM